MATTGGQVGGGYLSYEKIRPIAMAFCSVMLVIWIPITIANSYTIHNSGKMSNSQLCNLLNTSTLKQSIQMKRVLCNFRNK